MCVHTEFSERHGVPKRLSREQIMLVILLFWAVHHVVSKWLSAHPVGTVVLVYSVPPQIIPPDIIH